MRSLLVLVPLALTAGCAGYAIDYVKPKRELRACHPRDILRTLTGIARYLDKPAVLSTDLIDRACHTYFVEL